MIQVHYYLSEWKRSIVCSVMARPAHTAASYQALAPEILCVQDATVSCFGTNCGAIVPNQLTPLFSSVHGDIVCS